MNRKMDRGTKNCVDRGTSEQTDGQRLVDRQVDIGTNGQRDRQINRGINSQTH